jgi:hypothetical protein
MAYTLTYNTATAITTPAINSTKVIVFSNVACYSNINGTAVSTSAFPLIEPNTKNSYNMQGLNNTLSLLPVGGATAAITITQVGNVYANPAPFAGNLSNGNWNNP